MRCTFLHFSIYFIRRYLGICIWFSLVKVIRQEYFAFLNYFGIDVDKLKSTENYAKWMVSEHILTWTKWCIHYYIHRYIGIRIPTMFVCALCFGLELELCCVCGMRRYVSSYVYIFYFVLFVLWEHKKRSHKKKRITVGKTECVWAVNGHWTLYIDFVYKKQVAYI